MVYGKNKNRQYIIDRFGILEQIINLSVEKKIFFTMKSLILAQDER